MELKENKIEYGDPQEQFHIERYNLLADYVKDKAVLDIGGAGGYGAFVLAKSAKSVVLADIDENRVESARQNFPAPNIQYEQADVLNLKYGENSFDVVVAYELIEHLDAQGQTRMLEEIQRVLKPSGLVALSTPDKNRSIFRRLFPYYEHKKELSLGEFSELVGKYFSELVLFGQDVGRKMFGAHVRRVILRRPTDYRGINMIPQQIKLGDRASYLMILAKKQSA